MVRISATPLPFRGVHRHAGDLRFRVAAADGSQWVGHGLIIGINYVDVVGVGWGRSWLVRTPGNFDRVAISQPRVEGVLLPLGEGWDGASMLAGTHPRQL